MDVMESVERRDREKNRWGRDLGKFSPGKLPDAGLDWFPGNDRVDDGEGLDKRLSNAACSSCAGVMGVMGRARWPSSSSSGMSLMEHESSNALSISCWMRTFNLATK